VRYLFAEFKIKSEIGRIFTGKDSAAIEKKNCRRFIADD
jgi:hypothetical protein